MHSKILNELNGIITHGLEFNTDLLLSHNFVKVGVLEHVQGMTDTLGVLEAGKMLDSLVSAVVSFTTVQEEGKIESFLFTVVLDLFEMVDVCINGHLFFRGSDIKTNDQFRVLLLGFEDLVKIFLELVSGPESHALEDYAKLEVGVFRLDLLEKFLDRFHLFIASHEAGLVEPAAQNDLNLEGAETVLDV